MHTDHENRPNQTEPIPPHLDASRGPREQKAHIRKRQGDIDLQIVQLQNEKRDLRELHASIK